MNGYLYWLAAGRIMVRLLRGKIIFQSHDSLGRFDSIYGKLCERSRFFFFLVFLAGKVKCPSALLDLL